jgi:cysteinyl-tRNA synthetase
VEKIETVEPEVYGEAEELEKLFYEAMDDDFNTALALSYVFELSKMLNKLLDEESPANRPFIAYAYRLFTSLARMLGMLSNDLLTFSSTEKTRHLKRVGLTPEVLEKMIEERTQARKNKDYARADEIRETLAGKGIGLLDSPKGTEWRVKNLATTKGEP